MGKPVTNLLIWEVLRLQGRSLEWLASKTDFTSNYVRKVRCGAREPSALFQQRCETVLEVPASALFSVYEAEDASEAEEKATA